MSAPNLWERAKDALKKCTDDMEQDINEAYPDRDRYPDYARKWARDMELVVRTRVLLAQMERVECVEGAWGTRRGGVIAVNGPVAPEDGFSDPALLLLLKEDR